MDETIKIGDTVTGIYKTGRYIGEVTAERPLHYLVKVRAVLKHPIQGDLHNMKEVNVPIFHERKALALNEQTNIPKQMVKRFNGEIPSYKESLQEALIKQKNELKEENSEWAQRCLTNLAQLEEEYARYLR